MRKWFYAGAVVGGLLLLGAAPAQADEVPAPVGGLLSSLGGGNPGAGLDPAGRLNLGSPLGGSPLMDLQPGRNSADVGGPATDLLSQDDARAREADEPAGRKPARGSAPAELPVLGGLAGGGSSGDGRDDSRRDGFTGGGSSPGGLIPADLLGGLLGGGLTPDGRTASATAPRESALFDGGVPLLGGLGGLLPANEAPRTLPANDDDPPSSMPAGGTPVDPALVDPADTRTGNGQGGEGPASDEPVDDPRLHEEPINGETSAGKQRSFSDGGRPIAGEDQDFR